MKTLVIVESPTKAKTIKGFLGAEYTVLSSYGHVMDLPKSELGVNIEHNYEPTWVKSQGKNTGKALTALRKALKEADEVILASDEDREGEAIAAHLVDILQLKKSGKPIRRIVFHEITKTAIDEAIKHPREIDAHRVDAQTARRVLDRLVGYRLSPLLWKKIFYGLSAGRVQSVAVRMICEREEERDAFTPEEYWKVWGNFFKHGEREVFEAGLYAIDGDKADKLRVKNAKQAQRIRSDLEKADYAVAGVEERQTTRKPYAPFTTASLQAEASSRMGMSPRRTMMLAQRLYEGVKINKKQTGLITYHRTDSTNMADKAMNEIESYVIETFGKEYYERRTFNKKQKGAQEAHEAIRPTDIGITPDGAAAYLDASQLKLYTLIWQRAVASQMAQAKFDAVRVDVNTGDNKYTMRARGLKQTFDGFLRVYPNGSKENILPELAINDTLELKGKQIVTEQKFTRPPARYTEAMLIKALKDHGIGRPSTYAPTIETIKGRRYVTMDENRKLEPTDLGRAVNKLLVNHFEDIVDVDFTAEMEESLDAISRGDKEWQPIIDAFYKPFEKQLKIKDKEIDKKELTETPTDKICPDCKAPIVRKLSRYGAFYSCSAFPACKFAEPIIVSTGVTCNKCNKNELIERRTGKGKIFYGCAGYPDCENAFWDKPSGTFCPTCKNMMVIKGKKYVCSDKQCGAKIDIDEHDNATDKETD